jgi:hypothetical protein
VTDAAAGPEPEALFSVVAGRPTPTELAAVAAVIEGMVRESASLRRQTTDAGPSAWELSRRPAAAPIVPSRGAWNRFPL